ncbi:MAG: hypothetical protein WB424_12635 [Terracidiphilus sp.]
MAIDSILAQIDAEIAKLTQVRSLLANTGKIADKITERLTKKVGRPAKAAKVGRPAKAVKVEKVIKAPKAPKVAKVAKTKKRRTLSPEARQRIAEAQRKRWAAQKSKA